MTLQQLKDFFDNTELPQTMKIKPKNTKRKYWIVNLYKDNIMTTHKIHRLVITHFVPAISGKEDINHINGDIFDNRYINLEWCNKAENIWDKIIRRGGDINKIGIRKVGGKWTADICHNRISHNCGRHNSLQEAKNARRKMAAELGVVNKYIL